MAGYWFDADQARKFSRDWAKDLARFGISAAHQTDCALGFGEYRDIPKSVRVEIQKSLITHIKRRSKFSISVCLNRQIYREIFENVKGAPSDYTFSLLLCVNKIAEEIEYRGFQGKVAYFFEAEHAYANQANRFMDFMANQAALGQNRFRYSGHGFIEKKGALPLQAADMLAWQTRRHFQRMADGFDKPRKDFIALMRVQDLHTVVGPHHLSALRQLYANADEIFGESLTSPNIKVPGLDVAEGIMRSFGLNPDLARQVRDWLAKRDR